MCALGIRKWGEGAMENTPTILSLSQHNFPYTPIYMNMLFFNVFLMRYSVGVQ
jgi:hypothetical protein